jgi:hypothetical protein
MAKKTQITTDQLRDRMLAGGVRSLQKFGYPKVNADNIMTDMVYSAFFRRELEDVANEEQLPASFRSLASTMIAEIDATGAARPEPLKKRAVKK